MIWDWGYAVDILPTLLAVFAKYTLVATVLGTILAAILGLAFAVVRRTGVPLLTQAITIFIEVVRSTPVVLQLFVLFYVLPEFGVTLTPLTAGVIGLGVHYSCFYAEVYRAGIDAVPSTQWEAATALNLGRRHTWSDVVLPQAVRNVLPSLGNYAVSMFKETPFLALITVPELVLTAQSTIGGATFRYLEPLTLAGIIFLAASYPTALALRRLEQRLQPAV